jgi:hypothetical protein
MTMVCLVHVAALLLILVGSSTVALPTESFHSCSPSRMWMGADTDAPNPRRRPLKQSAVTEMALKIGLNVAPKGSTNKDDRNEGETKKKGRKEIVKDTDHAVPLISWGSGMERFFWGESSEAIPSGELRSTKKMTMHQIYNKESFPLVLLRGALSAESIAWALSLTSDGNGVVSDVEEIEQHELLVGGGVRALRRSLVSQLDPKGELLDGILSNLPAALVGGHGGDSEDIHEHPYEDGSVVYYRRTKGDFYDEHHDSYSSGETPRDRQRAYTILIYLRTPPGAPSVGGTEFTRLTLIDENENVACAARTKDGMGLVVKPSAGDALVWPNFDRDGNPYKDSVHRALPVTALRKESKGSVAQIGNTEDNGIDKVVVNLWFEGSTKSRNAQYTKKERNGTK